jgi:hypothetical protein
VPSSPDMSVASVAGTGSATRRRRAPAAIESFLVDSEIIGSAMVHGDGRPYLVALVTLDHNAAERIARGAGIPDGDQTHLAGAPEILAAVQQAVAQANARVSPARAGEEIRCPGRTVDDRGWRTDPDIDVAPGRGDGAACGQTRSAVRVKGRQHRSGAVSDISPGPILRHHHN